MVHEPRPHRVHADDRLRSPSIKKSVNVLFARDADDAGTAAAGELTDWHGRFANLKLRQQIPGGLVDASPTNAPAASRHAAPPASH